MQTQQNDVSFGYDPRPFLNGLAQVSKGLQNLTKEVGGVAGRVVKDMLIVGVAFKGAQSVVRNLGKQMPEIGQAFGIAKDIIYKNFAWPLRQAIMPLLQKMLDWVRDHRGMFVKWGAAVVSVFKTAAQFAKLFYDTIVGIIGRVLPSLRRLIAGDFGDFLSLMSLKLSVMTEVLSVLGVQMIKSLEPAFAWIVTTGKEVLDWFIKLVTNWTSANEKGNSLWTVMAGLGNSLSIVADAAKAAFLGLIEGFVNKSEQMMTPLTNLVNQFTKLLGLLGLTNTAGIRGAFKGFGDLVADIGLTTLNAFASALERINDAIEGFANAWSAFGKIIKGDIEGASKEIKSIFDRGLMRGLIRKGYDPAEANKMAKEMSPETYIPTQKANVEAAKQGSGEWLRIQNENKAREEAFFKFFGDGFNSIKNLFGGAKKENDFIITKTGKVISAAPDDNIIGTKSDPSNRGGGVMRVDNISLNITVTEGNARSAGASFADGFRDSLLVGMTARGGSTFGGQGA